MRRWWIGFFVGVSIATAMAQPFPPPLQQALTNLTTGVTPFTLLGMGSGAYINWGAGRNATGYGIRDNAGTLEFKNNGGSWSSVSAGDVNATYILQTPNGTLPSAQALNALTTGLLISTTGTGVLSAYTGSTCTNQFVRALSALGVATCNAVNIATDTTGNVTTTRGGTNVDSSAWNAIPTVTAGTWGQYAGTTCTNQAATALSTLGAATCSTITSAYVDTSVALTGTDINTSSQVINTHLSAPLPVAQGGTAIASYTVGDLIYASGATTLSRLADVAVGSYARSGGVGTAPLWSTQLLPNASTTGDVFIATTTNTMGSLADVAVGSYMRSGGVGTAPLWSTATLPNTATTGDLWYASAANTMTALADVAVGSILRSGGVGTAPAWTTATYPTTVTQGDLLAASAANVIGSLADVAVGSYLRSNGIGASPVYSTLILPNAVTANNIVYGSATNTYGGFACATPGTVLIGGTPPSCSATANVTTYQEGGNTVAPPIVLANSAAYTAIASTNSETYFGIGSDGLIPAGAINAAKHRVSIVLRGIYGTNGVTDSITLRVKLCTVSGCGSGTVTPIAVTGAVVPGAAVASQGWESRVDLNVFTNGVGGTIDAQGFTMYSLTALTAVQIDDMVNASTITIDTTANEYVSASVQFNNSSASNTITLRNFAAYVY